MTDLHGHIQPHVSENLCLILAARNNQAPRARLAHKKYTFYSQKCGKVVSADCRLRVAVVTA